MLSLDFMKALATLILLGATALVSKADTFEQDRTAILSMAGRFEVNFSFEEIVSLSPGYELKKPYNSQAHELVKVIEDTGKSITLQHLLVVEDITGPEVIKHWAQIWSFEDTMVLNFEGNLTWQPVKLPAAGVKGTWTQFVTQIDDSPRYKAAGKWSHVGDVSTWTSQQSTRPLPRRDASKRKDYDLLVVVNQQMITPEGWVHVQENRKLVKREGEEKFLCLEAGCNSYKRIEDETAKEGFEKAEAMWVKTSGFWKEVRHAWADVLNHHEGSVHYTKRLEGKRLMYEMGELAEKSDKEKVQPKEIKTLIQKYLR